MTESRTYALIFAGGRSSRMGTDKAVLPFGGQTLLDRAAAFWRGCAGIDGILVAAGTAEHLPVLPDGCRPVYDLYPNCGPMAGLHAAFTQTDAELLHVSAVDMPFLSQEALLPAPAGDAAVYTRHGRPEPLFGVYRRSCLPALEAALKAGNRKMTALLDTLDTEYIELPDALADTVSNWNTRADMLRALAGTPPTVVFMGWSGSGKTTFLEKLLPELAAWGVRAAVIKHDAHSFQMDKPGKDTWRFTQAGAVCTAISGPNGWAVLGSDEIELEALREKLPPVDLILVEGHKYSRYPKIQVHRRENGKPLIPIDATHIALVTDEPADTGIPQLGLEDIPACAELILTTFLPERSDPV